MVVRMPAITDASDSPVEDRLVLLDRHGPEAAAPAEIVGSERS